MLNRVKNKNRGVHNENVRSYEAWEDALGKIGSKTALLTRTIDSNSDSREVKRNPFRIIRTVES